MTRHTLGIVLVPNQKDVSDYITNVLKKFASDGVVKPYTMRAPNNNYASTMPLGSTEVDFAEGLTVFRPLTLNPFPIFDFYQIGGRFAGLFGNTGNIPDNKLYSLDFNSVKVANFPDTFCPELLLDLEENWWRNSAGLDFKKAEKSHLRILDKIKAATDATAVLLDFEITANTEKLSLV